MILTEPEGNNNKTTIIITIIRTRQTPLTVWRWLWQTGLSLTWDVIVATTLADSYISASASSAGAAAEMAASRKQAKYAALNMFIHHNW